MPNLDPTTIPAGQILVQQVGDTWQVAQPDKMLERFKTLDEALTRALAVFRERKLEQPHILVVPPESPFMWGP
jgi:ribosomal protein L16 Arg81 hydroxylase